MCSQLVDGGEYLSCVVLKMVGNTACFVLKMVGNTCHMLFSTWW